MESAAIIRKLCLECGLCCNGVLFKDVELQPEDEGRVPALTAAGIPIRSRQTSGETAPRQAFPQPCHALDCNGCCQVYADRPSRCRDFECALLKTTAAGKTNVEAALRIIRDAHRRVARVRRLFRDLDDTRESQPFGLRFRRIRQRFDRGGFDDRTIETYSELTLAVHALNVLLSTQFYPGDAATFGEAGSQISTNANRGSGI